MVEWRQLFPLPDLAESLKVLAQVNPAATTLSTLYTVPSSTSATASSLVVCNQGADATFRVSVAVAGAADNAKQYIYYGLSIPANETFIATIGLTLAQTDVVRVYCSTANCSFSLFGCELT